MRAQRKAFIILDAILGLCILGILMTLMAAGLSSHARAATKLADTRAACNAAETALADLQQGTPVPGSATANHVRIDRLTGASVVPDFTWVRITARANGRSVSLTCLAKSSALKGN